MKTSLSIEREIEQVVYYEEQIVGKRRVDFLINKTILVEVKAISELDNSCINQILNYIEAFNLEIGLLINFGKDRLEFKRYTNNKLK
ncbi:MAG: GxxExxY protein [Chitinophagaceae bacterium]